MKMNLISSQKQKQDLLELAHERFGLDNIFKRDDTTGENARYLLEQSWFVTFCSDDDEIYALLILEWVDERVASLHFCMFNRGNILKGWKMFLSKHGNNFDELLTYIPLDRLDVLRISKALGFKHTNDKEFYYGRLETQETRSTTTTTTTSSTGNVRKY